MVTTIYNPRTCIHIILIDPEWKVPDIWNHKKLEILLRSVDFAKKHFLGECFTYKRLPNKVQGSQITRSGLKVIFWDHLHPISELLLQASWCEGLPPGLGLRPGHLNPFFIRIQGLAYIHSPFALSSKIILQWWSVSA